MSGQQPLPVVVLISGRGSNMQALIERSRDAESRYRVVRVLSDQAAAAGLVVARSLGIEARHVRYDGTTERAGFERDLAAAIDDAAAAPAAQGGGRAEPAAPPLIVLAGFMRILSAPFVARYAGRMLNIHPSLLPLHPGLHTHRRALAAGDTVHGATVHFVTAQLDGGPAVIQAEVPVLPGDDEASLAARVQVEEHRIYPRAVAWFAAGRLRCRDGRAWLDGAPLEGPVRADAGAVPGP